MAGWENFFTAEVGASAALAGLVFVGISINLTKILTFPGLPGRAFEALMVLLAVLVISSLLLVPGQSMALIGAEVLGIGLIIWATVTSFQVNGFRKSEAHYRDSFIAHIAVGQVATLPLVISGIIILAQGASGLYWLVPGFLFCFISAILDAWVLLIEINR